MLSGWVEARPILTQLPVDYTLFVFAPVKANILFQSVNPLVIRERLGQLGIGSNLSPSERSSSGL